MSAVGIEAVPAGALGVLAVAVAIELLPLVEEIVFARHVVHVELGNLGEEQLKWLADDLKGKSAETPIVVFAHIPLWTVYEQWGWGTDDGARAICLKARLS
jgi:hypothetical protein